MELPQTRIFSNRDLLRIMVPLIIEQALANLVGLCDGVMVSAAGEAAMSGVSLVNMISNVILVLFGALTTGGAVVTSQYLGAKQTEKARQSAGQMVLMALILSLLLMAVCLALTEPILRLFFGAVEDDVMAASVTYFRYNAVSFPFIALYNAGAAIYRGQQQGIHEDQSDQKCDQCCGQCHLYLWPPNGRGGCCDPDCTVPAGGCSYYADTGK